LLMLKMQKKLLLPILFVLLLVGTILAKVDSVSNYGFGRYVVSLIGVRHIIMFCVGIILSLVYQKQPPQLLQKVQKY
jgi:hypothetical protein